MSYLTPVTGGYTVPKGMLYLRPRSGTGSTIFAEVGDMDAFTLEGETDKAERRSNQTPTAKKTFSAVVSETIMAKFTLFTMNRDGRAMAVAADKADMTQSSSTGDTLVLDTPAVGDIYDLGGFDITITAFEDDSGTPVTFDAGTHYELDAEAGLVKILALPAGASTDVTITYDKAAITSSADRNQLALFSNFDKEYEAIFRSTQEHGTKTMTRLHKVQLNPAGPRSYIGDELVSQDIELEVLADLTQPAGQEYGVEVDLA